MPYIGNTPALDYISYAVQNFTVTAGTTVYTLDYSVSNENDIRLVLNNVIQRPGASYAYSASGTTLTLTSATNAGDTMYAVFIGRAVQTVVPPASSITNTMLAPSVITGQTAETSVAGGDLVLIYDDSATALRKMTRTNFVSGLGGLTEADQWRLSTNFDIPQATTTVSSGWERSDEPSYSTLGTGMTESSGIFTFPSTGYYLVTFIAQVASEDYNSTNAFIHIQATIDNSTYGDVSQGWIGYKGGANPISRTVSICQAIIDVTSTTNVKVRFRCGDNDNVNIDLEGNTDSNYTSVTFLKLGDT